MPEQEFSPESEPVPEDLVEPAHARFLNPRPTVEAFIRPSEELMQAGQAIVEEYEWNAAQANIMARILLRRKNMIAIESAQRIIDLVFAEHNQAGH
jgi:hypothetical protein